MGRARTRRVDAVTSEESIRKRLRSSNLVSCKKSFTGIPQHANAIPYEDPCAAIPYEDPSLASPSAAASDNNKSEEIIPKAGYLTKREENGREDNTVTPCSVKERSLSTNTVSTPTSSSQYFIEQKDLRSRLHNLRPVPAPNRCLHFDPECPIGLKFRKPVQDVLGSFGINEVPPMSVSQYMEEDCASDAETVVPDGLEDENLPPHPHSFIAGVKDGDKKSPIYYNKPPSAPPLTNEMISANEKALHGGNDLDIIVGNVKRQELRGYKYDAPDGWLCDAVVDFYLGLIKARSDKSKDYPSVYIFAATFYTLLYSRQGQTKIENTTGTEDIFKYDLILIPVCSSHHWRLIVVNFKTKIIKSYNSMERTKDVQIIRNIEKFLHKEYARKHEGEKELEWTKEMDMKNVPQQDNTMDCGVFVLQFAEYLSRREDRFNFGPVHMPYFRQRMIYETTTGKLLTS